MRQTIKEIEVKIEATAKAYQGQPDEEIRKDREEHGKKPLKDTAHAHACAAKSLQPYVRIRIGIRGFCTLFPLGKFKYRPVETALKLRLIPISNLLSYTGK